MGYDEGLLPTVFREFSKHNDILLVQELLGVPRSVLEAISAYDCGASSPCLLLSCSCRLGAERLQAQNFARSMKRFVAMSLLQPQ